MFSSWMGVLSSGGRCFPLGWECYHRGADVFLWDGSVIIWGARGRGRGQGYPLADTGTKVLRTKRVRDKTCLHSLDVDVFLWECFTHSGNVII